jgi:two-component system repressor protein LuxO
VNILIVEDNAHMRVTLSGVVRAVLGPHPILMAPDGHRALILCQIALPKLVLMDMRLPDADGIDLIAEVKALVPEAIVVMVSHSDSVWSQGAAARAGASAYIVKDEVYEKLPATLLRLLGRDDSAQA